MGIPFFGKKAQEKRKIRQMVSAAKTTPVPDIEVPPYQLYWHIHHDKLVEVTTEPIQNRILYILRDKPSTERNNRLDRMQPVTYTKIPYAIKANLEKLNALAKDISLLSANSAGANILKSTLSSLLNQTQSTIQAERAKGKSLDTLHKTDCVNCPWNGYSLPYTY